MPTKRITTTYRVANPRDIPASVPVFTCTCEQHFFEGDTFRGHEDHMSPARLIAIGILETGKAGSDG